ncbi:unnamed protein product [Cuscuta campestris]|uniref:RING-type domain-containing protein n=1 Tax=Cuscuta campestris TaxID=132261 RepID=A0A484MB48_9ASTE|nr:unnamed protein product [Cuscuta campestris]
MVSHSVSLNPNQARIGTLQLRVIYKLSTAGQSIVVGGNCTAQPILFYPLRDLGSARNACLFFSGVVAGYLRRDPESTAPITLPMALDAFRVFLGEGRTRGLQICAEFEVVFVSPGFLDGGSLVLDALPPPSQEGADFVGSNSPEFEAAGFVDGGAMVLDPPLPYLENSDHVKGPDPRVSAAFAEAGFMDGDSLVLDALPAYEEEEEEEEEEEYESVDGIIPNFVGSNRGMTAAEISQLKKVTQSGGGGGTCSVCLDDFFAGEVIILLTPCSHSFHAGCIETWLSQNRSCPMCRAICTVL